MEGKDFCCFEFGEYRLDARRRSLSKNGEKVPLPARNFDLLLYMVENGGRILEHDELLDKVWAGTFVEQATLKKGISALRQILVEKPENEFIKTIPRRGYSFVSPVRVVPENNELYFVRETEREIIVEEYEETGDETGVYSEAAITIPPADYRELPAAEPPKSSFVRPVILCAAGIFLIVLTLVGIKPYFSRTAPPQFSVENVRVTRVTNNGKIVAGTAVSADGTYLVYPAADKQGISLWLRQLTTGSTSRLTPPLRGQFWGFAIAPDNSYIYYIFNNQDEPQKSGLYKIPLLGGEPQRIEENVSSIAVAPDGKRIALVRLNGQTEIFTVNQDGGDKKIVTALSSDLRLWGLSWTPDGSRLLVTLRKNVEDKSLFYISEISPEDGAETIVLPAQDKIIYGAVWMPDKSAVLMTMREPNADIRQIWQYFPDSAEWKRVTNDNNSYKLVSLTRDGKNILSTQESRLAAIWILDNPVIEKRVPEKKSLISNSGNFRQITDGVSNFDRVGWLADGRVMYSTTEDGREMIFAVNADGTNPRQLTDGGDGVWTAPSVSGSGQSIGFLSFRGGTRQIWRIDGDGKNLTKLTQTAAPVYAARIMRDNSTVYYTLQQTGGVLLYKQSADGEVTQLTEFDTGAFAVSDDERLLAVELLDKDTGKYKVELRSLPERRIIRTFDFLPMRQMMFTPDGKNLSYDAPQGDCSQIFIQPLDGSAAFALTDFQNENIFSFDWSPDGQRLVVIRGKQLTDAVLIKTGSR